jgi:hypothetical protein
MSKNSPSLVAPLSFVVVLTVFMGFALLNVGEPAQSKVSTDAPFTQSVAQSQSDQDRG